ncbi:MAG: threonine synthase [Eggerthellaceae bacterium]|nr:threonine synthase [Eggerthellaceae bacterium]
MAHNFYIDTRGLHPTRPTFTEAIIHGMADGGGLFVPNDLPQLSLDDILSLGEKTYAERAAFIYKAFGVDLSDSVVDDLMQQVYGENFTTKDICPIVSLDAQTHMLELWHGPTSAFKDMALQCLPAFFTTSAKQLTEQGKLDHSFMILVATSGDTGTAALEGFKDKEGVRIGVLYPQGGVSDIQFKQMATQAGDNVMVWGVDGNFDDCQTAAKAVFGDDAFAKTLLSNEGVRLSSANSINWGRLLPQVIYYVSSYAVMVREGKVAAGQPIDVCVPTGNFGNILAAWYAKRIGTPIDMLFCASNENRVLTDFINTGTYDISERDFVLTPSPSMDILVSSNLERQLFELTSRNEEAIRGWMDDLRAKRSFRVDVQTFSQLRKHFVADSVDSATCFATIKRVFEKHHYLLDPHTAVAYQATENLRAENPVLVVATAHWAKFGESVYRALHEIAVGEDLPEEIAALSGCELNALIAQETECYNIPDSLAYLDKAELRFTEVIGKDPQGVKNAMLDFVRA